VLVAAQVEHDPAHAVRQQTPSAQKALRHSRKLAQRAPIGFGSGMLGCPASPPTPPAPVVPPAPLAPVVPPAPLAPVVPPAPLAPVVPPAPLAPLVPVEPATLEGTSAWASTVAAVGGPTVSARLPHATLRSAMQTTPTDLTLITIRPPGTETPGGLDLSSRPRAIAAPRTSGAASRARSGRPWPSSRRPPRACGAAAGAGASPRSGPP